MNSAEEEKIRKALGEKLKKARLKAKLTQAEVAERAGIIVNHYAIIERGETNPKFETLQSILKALKIKRFDVK